MMGNEPRNAKEAVEAAEAHDMRRHVEERAEAHRRGRDASAGEYRSVHTAPSRIRVDDDDTARDDGDR